MKINVCRRMDKLYERLLEEKMETKGYCYFVSQDIFEEFRQEVFINFDYTYKAPIYRTLPVYVDLSLLKDTIYVFKKFDEEIEDDWWEHIPTIDCNLE